MSNLKIKQSIRNPFLCCWTLPFIKLCPIKTAWEATNTRWRAKRLMQSSEPSSVMIPSRYGQCASLAVTREFNWKSEGLNFKWCRIHKAGNPVVFIVITIKYYAAKRLVGSTHLRIPTRMQIIWVIRQCNELISWHYMQNVHTCLWKSIQAWELILRLFKWICSVVKRLIPRIREKIYLAVSKAQTICGICCTNARIAIVGNIPTYIGENIILCVL